MKKPRFSPEQEYETLRNELIQGKQYVFERPILIITGSIALIEFIDKQYAVYFPMIIIGLLLFNLWFTINRMVSMARVIAYIQIVLEDKRTKWLGWETSLRYYRKWLRLNKNTRINFKDKAVYDNLGFYPPIYYLHLIVTLTAYLVLVIYTINHFDLKNLILCISTLTILILFLIFAYRNRPNKVKPQIETNRQIWKLTFRDMNKLKV